jgi:hypothetical protein
MSFEYKKLYPLVYAPSDPKDFLQWYRSQVGLVRRSILARKEKKAKENRNRGFNLIWISPNRNPNWKSER